MTVGDGVIGVPAGASGEWHYIKITPVGEGGVDSDIPITELTVATESIYAINPTVTESGLIRTAFKGTNRQTTKLTFTAKNAEAGEELSGEITFKIFNVSELLDAASNGEYHVSVNQDDKHEETMKVLPENSLTMNVKAMYSEDLTLQKVDGSLEGEEYVNVSVNAAGQMVVTCESAEGIEPSKEFIIVSDNGTEFASVVVIFTEMLTDN